MGQLDVKLWYLSDLPWALHYEQNYAFQQMDWWLSWGEEKASEVSQYASIITIFI